MKLAKLIGTLTVGLLISTPALAATFAPPPPATPHLKGYPQWGALWWQWVLQTPAPNNPALDTTGANCAVNQPVPGVFLLAGSLDGSIVNRTCTVPVGTAFVMPLINTAAFAQQTDPPEQRTEAFQRSVAACIESPQPNPLHIEVDGQTLQNPLALLEKSVVFSVNLPANNVFGVPAQLLSPAVDEGWYAFVEPLTPGTHTLRVNASTAACGGTTQNVTYTLNVQGTVGTPVSCSGNQQITLNGADIQTTGVAVTASGNCNVTIRNSMLWGGTAAIVIHDQGHVIVDTSTVGGGFAFSADGHGHGEVRNSAVLNPNSVRDFAVVSDSGGNVAF
ncbi:MAG TPA: hypothetical protein VIF57_28645 [Polyangia bacterium]|jgi:hypothetical protein